MTELAARDSVLQDQTRNLCNWLQRMAHIPRPRLTRSVVVAAASVSLGVPSLDANAQKKGERVRVLAGSAMRTAPGGQVIGVLSRSYEGPVEMVQGSAVRLKLSGFVAEQSVKLEGNRTRGAVTGSGDNAGALRTGPSDKEPMLAKLQRGAVVFSGPKTASFLAVNRTVWVDKSRLTKFSAPTTTAAKPSAPEPKPPAPSAPKTGESSGRPAAQPQATTAAVKPVTPALPPMQTVGQSTLRQAPNGDVISSLPAGVVVNPLSSENGWTRVNVEGWVPTKDLTDASAKAAGQLSAAEVRADPNGTKGRMVRWTVEALSYQLGDDLRRELNGGPYLLARGPGNERAILYLAVPDSLVSAARALAPLTTITVTAKVRNGRSEPGGVPILDLVELVRR